jgi:hypothetical protein
MDSKSELEMKKTFEILTTSSLVEFRMFSGQTNQIPNPVSRPVPVLIKTIYSNTTTHYVILF